MGTNGPLLIAVNVAGQPLTAPPPQDAQSEEAQGVPPQVATTPAGDTRLVNLEQEISKQSNVQSVTPAATDKSGTAAVFSVTPKTSPSAYATQDLVNHLRDKTIPDATQGTGLTAYVGGTTASYIDLATKISDKLFLVIGIVVVLSFLLLTLAFRTVLVPLISALINLLAVAAAYGILTAVFEKGFASIADRRGPRDAGGQLRAADDVRDPLRALDGLPGVPGLSDRRAPSRRRGQQRGRQGGPGQRRQGDRRRGDDHVRRLLQLRDQRRPGRQAVRHRTRRRRSRSTRSSCS